MIHIRKKFRERSVSFGKQFTQEGREKLIDYQLKKSFGISLLEYKEMLKKQKGCCAICGSFPEKRRLSVDHNHITNEIRGLLCHSCNVALGHFEDNIDILKRAIIYLIH